jgi:hypothetical protein
MARKKREPIDREVARQMGGVLRDLRKSAQFRSVEDAATTKGCPAAQQTIYAYERGALVPSLRQFLDLVRFYANAGNGGPASRYQAVAAIHAAMASPAYGFAEAQQLMSALQPESSRGRQRTSAVVSHVPRRERQSKRGR